MNVADEPKDQIAALTPFCIYHCLEVGPGAGIVRSTKLLEDRLHGQRADILSATNSEKKNSQPPNSSAATGPSFSQLTISCPKTRFGNGDPTSPGSTRELIIQFHHQFRGRGYARAAGGGHGWFAHTALDSEIEGLVEVPTSAEVVF